jgi:DMSO/TMAO reductase YedYZ molybdopterin-dependent catalytic subunit
VRILGADGSDVVMGWGTLDPDFGALGAIAAITRDGEPLADPNGMARLIVPGDKDDGRSIPSIVRIELSDPGPATP